MKIGIIGLGLIGGSMAKALRSRTDHTIVGYDHCDDTLESACAVGALQGPLHLSDLHTCNLLIIALPPKASIAFLREHVHQIKPDTIVIDCCGIKRSICQMGFELAAKHHFCFMGGHPMAGREFSGFKASQMTLFDRAVMLLVPKEDENPAVISRMEALFISMGFSRVIHTTAERHDEMIAITSQLAHLVSNAYVKSPRAQTHHGFSAGSYADLTRVARLNETLWTELFLENGDYLIREIDELMAALATYRDAIANQDAKKLCELLKQGRECKEHQDEHR